MPWGPWQPLDGEERHDRQLSNHEYLPNMRRTPLIGLTRSVKHGNVNKHRDQGS